jgi:hypothetical protein
MYCAYLDGDSASVSGDGLCSDEQTGCGVDGVLQQRQQRQQRHHGGLWAALEGTTVGGRYELRTHLATGGMSAIFRGWDHRLARPVAIKLLRPSEHAEPQAIERFRREARTAASLVSPHIVEVYDFFEEHDAHYLVMELVEGQDLKRHIIERGPLPPAEALAIGAQVCRALRVAHAQGFIHRDIKPQNVLLTPTGEAKLADFGIVYVPRARGFTAGGIVLGTADYISPEQAQGLPLEPTTDLYSLGVVLYEALTGALPFDGETPMAVAMRHVTVPAPPLRTRRPELPRGVERVVMRALRKDPDDRYPTAAAMEAALERARAALCGARRGGSLASGPLGAPSEPPFAATTGADWRELAAALATPAPGEDADDDDLAGSALEVVGGRPSRRSRVGGRAHLDPHRLLAALTIMVALLAALLALHLLG